MVVIICFCSIVLPQVKWDLISGITKAKKKYTLVSGIAGDEKNLHPGGRKLIVIN